MKKIMDFIVNSISWLMIIAIFIYILEVIFDIDHPVIDSVFSALGLHRGNIILFITILLVVFSIIVLACLIRYLFSIKSSPK